MANNNREFYCFISYKHQNDDRFVNDSAWAAALARCLVQLHIPADTKPPIEDDFFINLNPKDESVFPVFRDEEVFKAGEHFTERIKKALAQSRKLVVVISDEMLKDQEDQVQLSIGRDTEKRYEKAWCYREIFCFLKNHSYKDILLVYIGDGNSIPDIIPSILTGGYTQREYNEGELTAKQIINYKKYLDYWRERDILFANSRSEETVSERQEAIAATIAAAIFGTDADQFRNYRQAEKERLEAEVEKRKAEQKAHEEEIKKQRFRNRFYASLFVFALIIASAIFVKYSSSRAQSFLDQAKAALNDGNRLKAISLCENGRKWSSLSPVSGFKEIMWAAKDSTFPCLSVASTVSFTADNKAFSYIDKNRYIVIVDSETFKEIDRRDMGMVRGFALSPDGNVVVSIGNKWGRVYNRRSGMLMPFGSLLSYDPEQTLVVSFHGSYLYDGDDQVYDLIHDRSFYLRDEEGNSFRRKSVSASFCLTDSLLTICGITNNHWDVSVYDISACDTTGSLSFLSPLFHTDFTEHVDYCTVSSFAPRLLTAFSSRISCSVIQFDSVPSLIEVWSDPIDTPIQTIRFCNGEKSALVIDQLGYGHSYDLTERCTPRLSSSQGKETTGKAYVYPLTTGWENGRYVLNYYDCDQIINVRDYQRGFSLPRLSDMRCIQGETHDGITLITAWIQDNQQYQVRSFIYEGGDRREIKYYELEPRFLSSAYVVHNAFNVFDSGFDTRSKRLYEAKSNRPLIDISIESDESLKKVSPINYFINRNYLAVVMDYHGNGFSLRFFDLTSKTMVLEKHFENYPSVWGWADDDSFPYGNDEGVFCIYLQTDTPQITQLSHRPIHYRIDIPFSAGVFGYGGSDNDGSYRYWYNPKMKSLYPFDAPDGALLSNTGRFIADRDLNKAELVFIDAVSMDTLSVQPFSSSSATFRSFSKDDRYYIDTDDGEELICRSMSTYKVIWKVRISEPLNFAYSSDYLVVQSSSLFVISLETGKIICEFDTIASQMLPLFISPNNKYLIAGCELFDIQTKEKLSSSIQSNVISLENDYIVYRDKLVILPSAI